MVTSGVVILVVIALRYLLRGKISPRVQYALWALVLARLLLPVSLGSTGLSVMNAVEPAAVRGEALAATVVGRTGAQTGTPDPAQPEATAESAAGNAAAAPDAGSAPGAESGHAVTVADLLKIVWLTGMAAVGLWLTLVNRRFARRLRRTRRAVPAPGGRLPAYVSAAAPAPCLFGLFRPAIYLTPKAAADETVFRHAMAHETAHFRHGDHIWSILRCVCLALHWYNPLVWWAASLSRRDAELACDAAALARLGENERAAYGRTLIGMTCRGRTPALLAATTMAGSKNNLKERITMIAKKPKMALYTLAAVILVAALAAGCTFTGAKTAAQTTSGAEPGADLAPNDAIFALFDAGDGMDITLHLADDGACSTYSVSEHWHAERYSVLLGDYTWTQIQALPQEPADLWLTITSADGTQSMTVWPGDVGYVQYSADGRETCWSAASAQDDFLSVVQALRMEYDGLDANYSRVAFEEPDGAQAAAGDFPRVYGEHMANLAPGNECGMRDYEVVDWTLGEISADGRAVTGTFRCAFVPLDLNSSSIWAGNTVEGTGAYAGKLMWYREFLLELQEDGLWHCTDFGTGGVGLPEGS